jgi:uncharacterized protein
MERMKAAVEREGGPFTLFGGEPLLLPLADLEELFRWGMEEYGHSGIQTNGILISDEHMRLFKTYNVDVGVSIDGPGELNDLRWHVSLERTRRNTETVLANIERLCREHRKPGLIVTLHRLNASADRLPRLHAWVRQLDALGIVSMRLHLLEVESEDIRQAYSLSDEENVRALLSFADLQAELKHLRFDVLDEMERSLLGQDRHTSCVWRACDPYTTEAVRGIEGNGQSSNCGRTNKDGIDFVKAERPGYERYLALYQTPQEHSGCQGCRFFLMCKGQCPGTALQGDWRNRSELCGVWKGVFSHLEQKLILQKHEPLSIHPVRRQLERQLLEQWSNGRNSPLHALHRVTASTDNTTGGCDDPRTADNFRLPPFVRLAFVGQAQRATWASRMDAVRTALARLSVLAVVRQLVPVSLVSVPGAEVFEIHNLAAANGLHARLLAGPKHEWREWMAIGSESITANYLQAWNKGDAAALDELATIPACCQDSRTHWRQAGFIDPVWPLAAAQAQTAEHEADVRGSPAMNFLLRPLGIDPLGYLPCAFSCEESQRLGSARIALGREAGMIQAIDWLEEMLDWPAEWSALHGIAELKTGIVKIAYNTDFTPEKVTVRYHGHTLATDGVRGLSFAYRQPQGRRRSLAFQREDQEESQEERK